MEVNMKEAALKCAASGLRVFPCHTVRNGACTCGSPNCSTPGKHPRIYKFATQATVDPKVVGSWWDRYPDANIGYALGPSEAVFDVDVKHDKGKYGEETMNGLEAIHGPLPDTVRSITGGGGAQYFFTTDAPLSNKVGLYEAIDFKTNGGMVILPPSQHGSGRRYEWEVGHAPGEITPAPLPQWIADAVLSPKGKTLHTVPQKVPERVQEGQRNEILFKLASSLRAKGLSEAAMLAALLEENRARCEPPLDDDEVSKLVHSAGKYEQGEVPVTATEPPKLDITSARDLMQVTFLPLIQAVNQLICEGLTLLVAASKMGKSWLVLLMAVRVARGEPFLGRQTTKCRVLYFALEDSNRRLQQRLRTMNITDLPDNLYFVTKAQLLDTGFEQQLGEWLSLEEGPAMVIVDTLQKVRGLTKGSANIYASDYDVMGRIKAIVDKHRAMAVLIHHYNKAKLVADPFEKISGSNGLMGAADTAIIMERERGEDTATVKYEGRDVWGPDFVIRFENGIWTLVSNDANEYNAVNDYESNPLVQLFRMLITENPKGGRWTYSNLQSIGLEFLGYQPFIDGNDCADKLSKGLANELRKRDCILVECGVKTTGGRGIRLQQVSKVVAFPTKLQLDE